MHFNALQHIYEELSDNPGSNYLGRRPAHIWRDEMAFRFHGSSLLHAVQTEETAVHTGWMRQVIVLTVESNPAISVFLRHEIETVESAHQSFVISGMQEQHAWKSSADIVVNCLWEGQARIDRALNFYPASDWITRVKYGFVLESVPELSELPSLILTHGPFGDIVNYPFDNTIYITWYPACLTYIGQTEQLPDQWESACEGRHNEEVVSKIYRASIDALGEYVPQLTSLKVRKVLAGAIMGHGKTDISDRSSGLHCRHGIGVEQDGDYYSVFTGKYTSGPANAMELQRMLR